MVLSFSCKSNRFFQKLHRNCLKYRPILLSLNFTAEPSIYFINNSRLIMMYLPDTLCQPFPRAHYIYFTAVVEQFPPPPPHAIFRNWPFLLERNVGNTCFTSYTCFPLFTSESVVNFKLRSRRRRIRIRKLIKFNLTYCRFLWPEPAQVRTRLVVRLRCLINCYQLCNLGVRK